MVLDNLSIGRKLTIGFGTALAAVALMCGGAIFLQAQAARAIDERSAATTVLDDLDQAIGAMHDQNASIRGLAFVRADRFVKKYHAAAALSLSQIADARALAVGHPQVLAQLDAAEPALRAWQRQIGDRMVDLSTDPANAAASAALASSEEQATFFNGFRDHAMSARKAVDSWALDSKRRRGVAESSLQTVLIGGSFATLAIMVGMLVLLTRAIATPVVDLTRRMAAIAGGETDTDIPERHRRDEVGAMGQALESFRLALIDKQQAEAEAATARGMSEEERARAAAGSASVRAKADAVVAEVGRAVAALAAGDLAYRIEMEVPAEVANLKPLKDDLNAALAQLQEAMTLVASNAEGIRSGTGEIGQAADDLSRRTEQQAASLEQTAAALDEITATVRKTAEGARHARETVGHARSDAERSGQVVRDAVQAMSAIEGSARQISQIIGVIDEIAFQTNLLALNAGVEAARAGDAGRGFAVVASEVRALAQRSADAAKEIKGLISASTQQVDRGVQLVGQTGEALQRIVEKVADLSGVVAEIAASAGEQAAGLQEVNTAVNQMDQVTQQNAAMVEQSTAASHALNGEAQELARLVGRFKLGAAATVATPAAQPRRTAAAARPAMKTVSARGGGAAPRPAAALAASEESWEEF